MSAEETFQKYFPQKRIPQHAFCEIKLLDERIYHLDYKTTVIRPVPIPLIVGTNNPEYGHNGYRWIDLLLQFKKLNSLEIREDQIDEILNPKLLHGIQLAHIPQTNEYYICGEGVHRIAFHKLSCKDFVMISVTKCVSKEIDKEPVLHSEMPSGEPIGILPRLLAWIRKWFPIFNQKRTY